ncbi:MAG TPA: Crp/Fnr family transcriptional regulator [Holophagaceae bacterium]|nr:Crp/Fnr family transcriptional regulator [Holophagaceae bacterium]
MAVAPYRSLWCKAPLFRSLEPSQVERVGSLVEIRRLGADQVLFVAGEPCTGFYVVLEGAIRLLKPQDGGEETLLNVIHPGQSFAEAALFAGGVFPATARGMGETLLARVPRDPLLNLLRSDSLLCLKMLESLAAWHHRLTQQVQQLRAVDSGGRLRAWLAEEARRSPSREVLLRMPKKILAGQLGMTPETLSRQLAQLKAKGLIQVDGPRIRVSDPEGEPGP